MLKQFNVPRRSSFVNEKMLIINNGYCPLTSSKLRASGGDDTIIEFLPSKKQAKLIENKNLIDFAKLNDIKIDWSCRKGECKKCTVTYNKQQVLACKTKVKAIDGLSKIQVIIPKEATV